MNTTWIRFLFSLLNSILSADSISWIGSNVNDMEVTGEGPIRYLGDVRFEGQQSLIEAADFISPMEPQVISFLIFWQLECFHIEKLLKTKKVYDNWWKWDCGCANNTFCIRDGMYHLSNTSKQYWCNRKFYLLIRLTFISPRFDTMNRSHSDSDQYIDSFYVSLLMNVFLECVLYSEVNWTRQMQNIKSGFYHSNLPTE